MMNQAQKAKKPHEEVLEEMETEDVEEVQVEEDMASRSRVLETSSVPHIPERIFSYLDPRSVKEASLVSR